MASTARTADDYLVQRLKEIVYTSLGPPAWTHPMNPVAALTELGRWTRDDHQWAEEQTTNVGTWLSLLDDVLLSWSELPHTVKVETTTAGQGPLKALNDTRERLRQERGAALDSGLRASLVEAQTSLLEALRQPPVLSAAWTDLLRAIKKNSLEREHAALGLLAALAEFQDRPWRPLSQRLWQVIGDDNNAIAAARAQIAGTPPPPYEPPAPAGETAEQRLKLAAEILVQPTSVQDAVVWLAYYQARVPQFIVELGSAVTLFEGRWLTSVVENPEQTSAENRARIPAEVAAHPEDFLTAWQLDETNTHLPFVLARIAIGQTLAARALSQARSTVEALLRLAAFYNRGRHVWKDTRSFMVFLNGEPDWRSLGIEIVADDVNPIDLAYDKTAKKLEDLAPAIGRHLPVEDETVAEALDLLRWLTEARHSWIPGTLVLSVRVLEKVAGWAGYNDWARFTREQLSLPWAFERVREEIAETGRVAVSHIDRSGGTTPTDPVRRAAYLEATGPRAILDTSDIERPVNMRSVLKELDWLAQWQPPGTKGELRIAQLRDRVTEGPKTALWIKGLIEQFEALLARSARTRNSLIHGGPVAEQTVVTVARFVDEIASDALNYALDAQLKGDDVAKAFTNRHADLQNQRTRMVPGWNPAEVLFA